MLYKKLVKEIALLVGPAIVTAVLVNSFSPRGIDWFGQWDKTQGVITADPSNGIVDHSIDINDVAAAKAYYDSGAAVFVDARSTERYEESHIRNAVSLPVDQFDQNIADFFENHPFSTLIIVYCSGRECDQSHELAHMLIDAGFSHVRVLSDGLPGWRDAGYPIE